MSQSSSSAAKASPDQSTSKRPWFLVFIFRLLLLGVGGGLALILGIVFANIYPNPNPEKPLFLRLLARLDHQMPIASPSPTPTPVPTSTNSPPQLTPVQRQQVQAQLAQLQAQLRALNESTTSLEAQFGTSRADEPLETRLQAIALQLEGVAPPSSNALSAGNSGVNAAQASSKSSLDTEALKVTLPSDVLFEENNSVLRPEAGLILDKIIADLRNYPAKTIRIAAYTDGTLKPEESRELSFRRAQAVQQYLTRSLGDQYRWLVLGYGATRPLVANDTASNQQRNRRIEIAVN